MSARLYRIAVITVFLTSCRSRFFQDGFDHHYVYKAKSDFLGMHNVTTIIKFHVHRQNMTTEGDQLNALLLDSFVQFSQSGQYAENPLKWNLSRPFLFTVSPVGIVLHVHVHSEEEEEVAALKKVISGMFSANVKIKNDSQWTYNSTDTDHIGTLEHEYTGSRKGLGIQLRRYHRSVDAVERLHIKTMDLDKYGTVENVEGEDNIILENRLDSDFETKRIPYPEEYVIKTTEEGDIGIMRANAEITMKLISKRRVKGKTKSQMQYHGLQKDSNLQRQEKVQKESLATLEKHIQAAINCSHQYSDKSNTNRTICVNSLRQNVTSLNEKDYAFLVSKFLARVCEQNDTRCEDERLLFTDIVARAGDEISQELVLRYVFQTEPLDEEAVRRALIHFTTLERPIWNTVAVVKKLCFGENNTHHGAVKMPLTVQRACLTVGVLAKALSKNDNDTAASAILEKLHTWLYEQGDETPEHLRPRRSTINVDTRVSSEHLLSKFVLLHSLGNAAHPSSIPHLHEYAKPNTRIPAWRRAALTALNFDKGNKTAQVLLDSLTYDKVETVRATAMEQFLAHPLQHNVSKSLGDVLLSQNYSYPTVLRLKRAGDLNAVLLEFKVELPEVHWGKSVGNAAIGASFGVDMVNRMHLRIKPLSGFFHINIWDRVYAEAHVGILGLRIDILRIEACYRGKLEYNLNILKDFSYGEAQKDFDEYDNAAGEIVTPIVDAVAGILDHFKTSSGQQSIFQPLTDAVKAMPVQARQFLESSLALLTVLDRYQGIPLVSRTRLLAYKVQGLAEDIKADTLNFYNEIADTTLILLPHAETQITEGANMMVDAQKKLGSTPQQAFESLNKAKQRIKYATYSIIKAKATIQDALSPHGGSLPTWLSSQEEMKMAITAAQTLLLDIKTKQATFASVSAEELEYYVDWQGLTDIQNAVEKVIGDMQKLNAGVKPFHIVVTDKLKTMQEIKLSVDKLDKKTQETQNNVKKSFGPKFTKQFPAQRREPDSSCERGIWPSTTGGRYKDTPGIDVIVEEKSKVVCPVNGKVYLTCNEDEVRIIPSDPTFKMFTIFIRNIDVVNSVKVQGTEFKAGQPLGHGRGKNSCSDPYIHVAMRKMSENGSSECSYVDPSSYVDNIKPFPKWQEECKEFVFKHIGNIIEAGLSGLGFEDIVEELSKRALAWAGAAAVQKIVSHFPKSKMAKMAGTMAFAYLSQHNSEIANVFMTPESQKALMEEKCEDMAKTTTSPTTPSTTKKTQDAEFSAGKQSVNKIMETLNADSTTTQKSIEEIQAVIERLKNSSTGIQLDDMSSMAFSKYGKILEKLNIPSKGSKQSMETTLQMLSWKVCPTFENGIAQGYGHFCVPSEDCFGLNCTIRIPHGLRKDKMSLAAHFDRVHSTFIIHTTNNRTTIVIDGSRKQFNITGIMSDYHVTILSHPKTLNTSLGQVYQLTLSAVVCDLDARCLPEIHIFHNLTFLRRLQQREIRSSDGCSFGADIGVENVGHIGGSIDVDKNGHVSGGGVDLGVNVGNVDINSGFQMNDQGEWGVNVGADVDLGDGNTVGTEMSLEGDGETLTFGLGVDAQFGDKGSVGGFIQGNTDGQLTAGVQGNVNTGAANVSVEGWIHHDKNGTSGGGSVAGNFGGKGHIEASVNRSANGAIDAGLKGGIKINNTTLTGGGFIHHDKNGTSGGAHIAANMNGKGEISASVNASSNGTIDAGISGSAQIGNSTISGAGYVHHDKNGTSGGGVVAANIDGKGHIAASLNASSDGSINAGVGGSAQIGNSTISGAGYVHHDKNGTSGGGVVDANIDGKGHIAASLNASSDGSIDAGVGGSAQIGNSTISGAGYVHHDKNGTSGGGVVAANIDGKGHLAASLNASSDGSIDAGVGGSAQIGNSTISGAGYVHHDQNGTSGGGMVDANVDGKGHIAASLNASSDGSIDAGVGGSAQIGNSTISGAGYVHHDQNGTSGGGMIAANIDGKGQIAASLNASSDGSIDAGVGGSAQIANSTISGAGYVHHDKNGTSGGGIVDANIDGKGHIAASLNASSDGSIDAGVGGSAQIGNSTISGAGYVHHDNNGTSGGGVVAANIDGKGHIAASLNASSDGSINAGVGGSAQIGNSTISGAGYVHHDKNGTSGGGVVDASIGGKGHIAASLNASSDGSIDAGVGGSAQIGNSTISGAGYVHHDKNGTSGGGVVAANVDGKGHLAASLNASSDGSIDAGVGGSAQIGNSTISGAGYVHHDQNGTSGGGVVDANIDGKGQLAASLNASSDGSIDAGVGGSAQIGNSTISGAGYVHHDQNGTSGGGMVDANVDGKGHIAASLNASSDGSIDAGVGGSARIGNSTISGAGYVHHDQNGTSGGGVVDANIDGKGQIAASLNASSDGSIDAGVGGSAQIGNSTISGAGYVHHDQNGTSGGGMIAANIDGKGQIAASLNASSDGSIDAGVGGSAQIANSTISGAGYVHHDKNGTSGGGIVDANMDGKGHIAASLNASSDGSIDAGVGGSAQIANSTISGAVYVHHDKNGTSGAGVVDANIDGKGQIAASLNASSDGSIDAGVGGSAQMGNSTISGAGYVHHDQNGTSGGGVIAADIDGKGQIAASLNASSDGSIDAGVGGSTQIGNSTISGAGYVHHDKNGTSGGGVVDATVDGKGHIAASVNASSDGNIDSAASGSAQIGNSTISGGGYVHHDKNGTSQGGTVDADINGKGHIAASFNSSSSDDLKAGFSIGNTSIIGNSPLKNGTAGGDVQITKRDIFGSSPDDLGNDKSVNSSKFSDAHHVNVRSAGKCSVDLSANFGDGKVDVGAEANIPGFGKVGAHATIEDGQLKGELTIGDISIDLGDVQKLTMDTFNQFANDFNLNADSTDVLSGFRDGTRHQVCTTEMEMSVGYDTEAGEEDFPARDKKDGVVYKDKHIDITIFKVSYTFGIGPIGIKLSFGAGGAIGTDMWSDIHANKGTAGFSIGPWVSGMVWGGLSIELGIASGGIKLIGYILKTKFPVTMETKSNKHPLTVLMNIDLELTPIELSLRGWAKVFFAKVFDKCLWKWACPPITWNILRKELENKDEVPPKFVTGTFCGDYRGNRAVQQCSVRQIINRHPTDTAYQLEVSATDEDSSVKTWYAIGSSPGGRDVQQWTTFKGDNQVVPSKLPNGVPLYFTVKAQNQQGLESFLQCRLDTYDNTLPDGRIEASHQFSSHPGKLTATVIVNDDSPIETTYKALGLSPGQYGREIEDWDTLYLSKSTSRAGIFSDLKHFSIPRKGKLIVQPLDSEIKRTPELCAKKCLGSVKCVSFDYEQVSETCQLHDVVQSHSNKLHISGGFYNYERLGGGYTAFIEYQNQPLEHGTVYYVNVLIENTLKYRSALFSEGTLIDFTPPLTGELGNAVRDVTVSHYCKASVRQRCEEVTDLPNHRMVIDGPEGRTVFSGNKPLFDTKYTLTNHYVTANWDGFADPESGIWGFSWAVGRTVCGQEIVKYVDPHRHISSPKYWTYSGFHDDVALPDGEYYITVEALNNVVFGGALVTTVCHSVPFTVDTTPPFFHKITDVMFDEDFDILAAYYNVSDGQSGISRVDFGLGMTKHDVGLRAYSRHDFLNRSDPYLVIENLELQPGIPAWVRLRAVNNVGLFASGHAEAPIMVDKTPPVPGAVFDGDVFKDDIQYQSDTENICAQWKDFFDPESGIKRFIWGVGTLPELDDIVAFKNISRFKRQACEKAHLTHNTTYYSTVVALNDALNSKRSNSSSDGVLVDITPPLSGNVNDRYTDRKRIGDIDFTSETATVFASWYNFTDPESDIDHYDISIKINNETVKTVPMSTATLLQDHSLTLNHLDYIEVQVSASNGAKLQATSSSDGMLVDHTPPIVHFIHDTKNGNRFQSENTKLNLEWEFSDPESSIDQYRYQVNEIDAGIKTTIFPPGGDFKDIYPESATVSMELDKLHLNDGAIYKVHLIAFNKARLSSSHESEGVLVDTTTPIVKNVKLAMPKEEEDLDETDTYVLLAGSDSLTVSWIARDSESGIQTIQVGIGVFIGDTSVSNGYVSFNGEETHVVFRDLNMKFYADESPILYYVSVIAINYAGLQSNKATSKPIKILHENVPGIVYDGREELTDAVFTRDKTSIGISFGGFESETCNIVGYEWAVGTTPFLTDILPFTDYGIVLVNKSQGQAQIHIELYESQIYYASVRARTGQMCKQEFIMSVSDGIKLDTNGPEITLYLKNETYSLRENSHLKDPVFQQPIDNIEASWKTTDDSGIGQVDWMIGNLPGTQDVHDMTISEGDVIPLKSVSLYPGKANFLTVKSSDTGGMSSLLISPAITVDTSVPVVNDFLCTKVLSDAKSLIGCKWSMISDSESPITSLSFGISLTPLGFEILNFTDISIERRNWYRDIGNFISDTQITKVYMALRIWNAAGKQFIIEETAILDRTPPVDGNILIVTQDSPTSPKGQILCQSSDQYIEIQISGFTDKESGLARYEIGLGSSLGGIDILQFRPFDVKEHILIDGLQLIPGAVVFASVKVYNNVNLFSTHFSHQVVISPSPKLSVIDGGKSVDQDFLSQLNVIQGQWKYSDPCPIQFVEWSIEDLVGNTIQSFKPILNANTLFLNDELRTENGLTYVNIIRSIDALNRTRLARSDGITVRIQPPKFASVRDGLEHEDINYQRSTSELSGNWDAFGETTKHIPSQIIVKYEVAVGNDRRYPNTRTNVHGFVDVGMNRTITFTNLKLNAKLVRYYLTVRAYSAAGSFIEGYSNGIRVGYEEIIKPGNLKYSGFQSSTTTINIGWSDFISDYSIRHYETAVGKNSPNTTNDTVDCSFYKSKFTNFDKQELRNVGLNTFSKLTGLSLLHGESYFVTVLAEDESGSCISVTSGPIEVDTTRPSTGKIFLNGAETDKRYNFINGSSLKVSWENFSDSESGIAYYHVQLAEKEDCNTHHIIQNQIVNVTEVTFYHLNMAKQYVIELTATNRANLSTTKTIASIFIDSKGPLKGDVKVGEDWQNEVSVQQSQTTINATMLIAKTEESYICPLQNDILLISDAFSSTLYPLAGNFTPECVTFTTKRLQIQVKIDEHILTEIVKGGVQTDEMDILEGTYTFKMKGLKGKQMVSSVAISRDTSTIPFQFNDTLEDGEPYGYGINGTEGNHSENGIITIAAKERYGTGLLIPGYQIHTATNSWNVLFWAADMFNVRQQWVSIDFDPTSTEAKYDFILKRINDTEEVKWEVILTIDGVEKATINALTYGLQCRISILGYNKDGYVPKVNDIFNPFYSEIDISTVQIPSNKSIPCKYGKSFYDGESGIREIWAGLSNSINQTQTIMPYALQQQYCLPCKNRCFSDCDPDCTLEINFPTELFSISLSNLTLLPSSNSSRATERNISSGADFDDLQTESYYINIKVVDFAGNSAETVSNAVIVDNTPPEFDQLSCVDPVHSSDEPALYQGTNSSVGAFWNCKDDISQIERYTVCVGSSGGLCDIKLETNVGLQTSVLIDGLDGLLLDETTYFLTVSAYNEADLKTSRSCNITVELKSPITEHSKSKEMFSVAVANPPPNVAFSNRTDRLGIQWESKNNDTEFFEWEIGSNSYDADIFPRVKIGTEKSKKAAIIDGRLWLDGVNINTTVKEYVLTNWTEEEIAEAKAHGNFFNFEPGRCIHINLYSVNRAHLSSKIPVKPICMKREKDLLINFEDQTTQTLIASGNKLTTIPSGTHYGEKDMIINLRGTSGGLIVGLLDNDDLDGMYGSAASDKYNPFISSPLAKTKTSRLLRKRFHRYSGMSFYVSPTGDTKLADMIEISLHFNNTETATLPALVFWDQIAGEWLHVTEDCKAEEHINYNTKTYKAKVCMPSRLSETGRQRRSVDVLTEVDGPRQFSLVFISREITQTAPVIQTTSLTYAEDLATVELKTIHVYDDEDDNVTCSLIGGPLHGDANITADGRLYYKSDHDFAGNDIVEIECIETSLPPPRVPQPSRATINLFVTEVNDAPDLLFIRDNVTFKGDRNNKIILPFESNTTGYLIGTFFASDIDMNDSLTENVFETSFPEANLTLQEIDDLNIVQQFKSIYNKSATTAKVYRLELSISTDFFGVIEYGLIVNDIAGHWSLPIKLSIGVLFNPCVHGGCAPLQGLSCSDFSRAKSFDNFWCYCEPGYEGKWCEKETNECGPEPCALMFDCEDLVAGYKCNINIPKLMAILICSLLAIGLVCFAIYRKKEQLNKNMKVSHMNLHTFTRHQCDSPDRFIMKYGQNPFEEVQTNDNDGNGSDTDSDFALGTEISRNDVGGSATNISSVDALHGVQLESVGVFRPPHHAATILTQLKKKQITPIET